MQKPHHATQQEIADAAARSKVEELTEKRPFVAPKLIFIEPKLVRHGSMEGVTAQGFFGSFSP